MFEKEVKVKNLGNLSLEKDFKIIHNYGSNEQSIINLNDRIILINQNTCLITSTHRKILLNLTQKDEFIINFLFIYTGKDEMNLLYAISNLNNLYKSYIVQDFKVEKQENYKLNNSYQPILLHAIDVDNLFIGYSNGHLLQLEFDSMNGDQLHQFEFTPEILHIITNFDFLSLINPNKSTNIDTSAPNQVVSFTSINYVNSCLLITLNRDLKLKFYSPREKAFIIDTSLGDLLSKDLDINAKLLSSIPKNYLHIYNFNTEFNQEIQEVEINSFDICIFLPNNDIPFFVIYTIEITEIGIPKIIFQRLKYFTEIKKNIDLSLIDFKIIDNTTLYTLWEQKNYQSIYYSKLEVDFWQKVALKPNELESITDLQSKTNLGFHYQDIYLNHLFQINRFSTDCIKKCFQNLFNIKISTDELSRDQLKLIILENFDQLDSNFDIDAQLDKEDFNYQLHLYKMNQWNKLLVACVHQNQLDSKINSFYFEDNNVYLVKESIDQTSIITKCDTSEIIFHHYIGDFNISKWLISSNDKLDLDFRHDIICGFEFLDDLSRQISLDPFVHFENNLYKLVSFHDFLSKNQLSDSKLLFTVIASRFRDLKNYFKLMYNILSDTILLEPKTSNRLEQILSARILLLFNQMVLLSFQEDKKLIKSYFETWKKFKRIHKLLEIGIEIDDLNDDIWDQTLCTLNGEQISELINWVDTTSIIGNYVLGIHHLFKNEIEDSIQMFESVSKQILSTSGKNPELKHLLNDFKGKEPILVYYHKIIDIGIKNNCFPIIINFAQKAIKWIDSKNKTSQLDLERQKFLNILFLNTLQNGDYDQAYEAIIKHDDDNTKDQCLDQFITKLCEDNQFYKLIQYPLANLKNSLVNTLEFKARNQTHLERCNYRLLLYTYFINRQDFENAAIQLYYHIQNLDKTSPKDLVDGYLLLSNTMKQGKIDWIYVQESKNQEPVYKKRRNQYDFMNNNDGKISTLKEIEKSYLLLKARYEILQSYKKNGQAITGIMNLHPSDLILLYLKQNDFAMASALCIEFQIPTDTLLKRLVETYFETSGDESRKIMDRNVRLLQNFLDKFDKTGQKFAQEWVKYDENIPLWLIQRMKPYGLEVLAKGLYARGNLEKALIIMIESIEENVSSILKTKKSISLNLLQQLITAPNSNNEKIKGLQEKLEGLLYKFLEKIAMEE